MNARTVEAKGFAGILGKRGGSQVFDTGSPGLVATRPFGSRQLLFSALANYNDLERYEVRLTSAGSTAPRKFWKIFVRKRFPYLSLRPEFKDAYKTFFVIAALIRGRDDHEILVIDRQTGDSQRICDIMALGRGPAQSPPREWSDREIAALAQIPRDEARLVARDILETGLLGTAEEADLLRLKVFAALRVNHRFIRSRLQRAEAAERTRLARSINTILEPYFLGPHRFSRRLASIRDQELHEALTPLFSFIESIGASGFLNNGTLLGARRSGDMLPHDDDLDIAIHVHGDTETQIAEEWRQVRNAFRERYEIIDKGAFFAIDILDRIKVDVFPAWTLDGRAYVYPICAGEMAHDDLLPVSKVTLRGTAYPAPRNVEALLALNYGPNWRVPDRYWKFDRKAAKRFGRMKNHLYETTTHQDP